MAPLGDDGSWNKVREVQGRTAGATTLIINTQMIYHLSSVNIILTCLNISTGQSTGSAEMDSDEFTLFDRIAHL